jgi:hypothetical protein
MKTRILRKGKLAGGLGLLLALTLMLTAIPAQADQDQPGHHIGGPAYICSTLAEVGTPVVAVIADSTVNWTTAVDSVNNIGYDVPWVIPADNPETSEKDGGEYLDPILIYIDGKYAGQTTWISCGTTWHDWHTTQADLMVYTTTGGTVTAPGLGKHTYNCGTPVPLVAEATTGYGFSNWTGTGVDAGAVANVTNPSTTITMNGNYDVTANFVQIEEGCALTTHVSPPTVGHITLTPPGSPAGVYVCGTQDVAVEAFSDNTCYYFHHWSGNLTGSQNPASIDMDTDMDVTAVFYPYQYTLTTVVDGDGSIEVSPDPVSGKYDCCTVVSLTASTDNVCWYFDEWSGDVYGVVDNTAKVHMSDNKTVTAHFKKYQYTLTTNVDPVDIGHVTLDPPSGPYDCCSYVTVNAISDNMCYEFDYWSGGLTGSVNPTSIHMSDNKTVTAHFKRIQRYLTVASGGGGSVTDPGLGEFGPYDCCITVNLTAEADDCYEFDYWDGGVDNISSANTSIHMSSENETVTAYFKPTQKELTVNSTSGGSTDPSGTDSYSCGANVTLEATPNDCNRFINWFGDIGTLGDPNSKDTWIIVDGDYTITANFTPVGKVLLYTDSGPGGHVAVPGEAGPYEYDCCTTVNLTAEADTDYEFDYWDGNVDNKYSANASIHMATDEWVKAYFKESYPTTCNLTVSSSAAGKVTVPGEGTFTYECGQPISLQAEPEPGFTFYKWIGSGVDAGKVANPNAASTSIFLDNHYDVKATFSVWTLDLSQGWNIMSTPVELDECCNTLGEFVAFGDIDIDPGSCAYYFRCYDQRWIQALSSYVLHPCDAVYIKMAHADTAPIIPTAGNSAAAKELCADWNLVSLAALEQLGMGLSSMYVDDALTSIYLVTGDKTGYAQVVSPPADQESWYYIRDDGPPPEMVVGKGYWVFMINEGTLGGFTFTPWK